MALTKQTQVNLVSWHRHGPPDRLPPGNDAWNQLSLEALVNPSSFVSLPEGGGSLWEPKKCGRVGQAFQERGDGSGWRASLWRCHEAPGTFYHFPSLHLNCAYKISKHRTVTCQSPVQQRLPSLKKKKNRNNFFIYIFSLVVTIISTVVEIGHVWPSTLEK